MSNQQPALRAFTVIKREGQDDYWLPIGAAFEHKVGEGRRTTTAPSPRPRGRPRTHAYRTMRRALTVLTTKRLDGRSVDRSHQLRERVVAPGGEDADSDRCA